jgi:ATP-binding cassette subfamily C protein CydD
MAFEQAFILILVLEFYLPLRLLGLRFHAGMAGATAARQIYEALMYPPIYRNRLLKKKQLQMDWETNLIRFEDVSFAYNEKQPVLDHISLRSSLGK